MAWSDLPQAIVAATVTSYWICVFAMVVRSWAKFRVSSGSLPKTRLEKRMWILWVPTIIAWIWLAWNSSNWIADLLREQATAGSMVWSVIVWMAAVSAVSAFFLTTRCWMSMGRNWSMAVTPDKNTTLITDGPFSAVRHPIYALSLLLIISSLIVVTNPWMLLVAISHCSMLILKAWNEERYLTQMHGREYLNYLSRTNRFFPARAILKCCLPDSGQSQQLTHSNNH
jgi:protein-S-isoprenylcysteine O-methyltransferase Ste14